MTNDNRVSVSLSTNIVGGKIIVNLEFNNHSNKKVYLDKMLIGQNGNLEADVFNIEEGGERINYSGPSVKRKKPSLEDFIVLNSGNKIKTTFDITNKYEFKRQKTYTIQYDAIHQSPIDQNEMLELKSEIIKITF